MQRKTVGIIGGGQLGEMLIQAGINYPIDFKVYRGGSNELNNYNKIIEFGKECDIITIEIENVNTDALKNLRDEFGKTVYPQPEIIELIKDRTQQKEFLVKLATENINTMKYVSYNTIYDLSLKENVIQPPFVNKIAIGGYDGYGTKIIRNDDDMSNIFNDHAIIEEYCDIKRELAIIVGRNIDGEVVVYPPVTMKFNDQNMLDYLVCPAEDVDIEEINRIGNVIVDSLNFIGIVAIELFESKDGKLYVNELAPRPHNSGHHTQDMFNHSQYDILLRCLIGLPLPQLKQYSEYGACINILGNGNGGVQYNGLNKLVDGHIHLYNKSETRPYRKMGHYNIMSDNYGDLKKMIDVSKPILQKCVTGVHVELKKELPIVGVIMGSISDMPIMEKTIDVLKEFKIPHEVNIISAHRTPEKMIEYAKNAAGCGIKLIIAGAGGAAHLPGMTAACTVLPVIGVPIKSSNSLDGWDSILSILQMPNGVPTATVNLNGGENAGLLAARILSYNNEMHAYQQILKNKVNDMNDKL